MKILILNGSPRPDGNTVAMAKAFAKGAAESGHDVELISVCQKNIAGCLACEYCHTRGEGRCVQQDDMQQIYPAFYDCDVLCLATPIYCYAITARLKAFCERLYAAGMGEVPMANPRKETVLLCTAAEGGSSVFQQAVTFYRTNNSFNRWRDVGMVLAGGCGGCPGPRHLAKSWENEAYQLGKRL